MSYLLLQGDAGAGLPLRSKSVHCCVTSPPYLWLRNYGLPPTPWPAVTYSPLPGMPPITVPGCDPACAHEWGPACTVPVNAARQLPHGDGRPLAGDAYRHERVAVAGSDVEERGAYCVKCGGWTGCLGSEADPYAFIGHLVHVFREVHRVLRDDGTLWMNMGDCYIGSGRAGNNKAYKARHMMFGQRGWEPGRMGMAQPVPPGMKAKDLAGMPWRIAFALQADGWYLRADIIWNKPNPKPSSVQDRPSTSHEYIFLFSKRQKYYYDTDAIREPCKARKATGARSCLNVDNVPRERKGSAGKEMHAVMKIDPKAAPMEGTHGRAGHDGNGHRYDRTYNNPLGRNKRSVWTVAPFAFRGAHFATFPPRLIEPCILAGTSEAGCCRKCGKPWRRQVAKQFHAKEDVSAARAVNDAPGQKTAAESRWSGYPRGTTDVHTVGWEPGCKCQPQKTYGLDLSRPQARQALNLVRKHNLTDEHIAAVRACGIYDTWRACVSSLGRGENTAETQALAEEARVVLKSYAREFMMTRHETVGWEQNCKCAPEDGTELAPVPCTVLDIFNGSGTTGVVALGLGRRYVGVDLSAAYLAMSRDRLETAQEDATWRTKARAIEPERKPRRKRPAQPAQLTLLDATHRK